MKSAFRLALLAILFLALGLGSAWVMQDYFVTKRSGNFHHRMHHELGLSPTQDAAINEMETRFAAEKREIEERLHQANARLGSLIKEDKRMSPRVQRAVAEIHTAMGDMQRLTLQHIFEMTEVLTPRQADKFYGFVADAFAQSH